MIATMMMGMLLLLLGMMGVYRDPISGMETCHVTSTVGSSCDDHAS
jgi:hypothetical protein